jgi:hypothetical protein
MAVMLRALGAEAFHVVFDIDWIRLLKAQLAFERVALLERITQLREHHMITAGIKLYLLARLDLQASSDLIHVHDIAVHFHLVDGEVARLRQPAADQTVRFRVGIRDRYVSSSNVGSGRSLHAPTAVDDDRIDFELLSNRDQAHAQMAQGRVTGSEGLRRKSRQARPSISSAAPVVPLCPRLEPNAGGRLNADNPTQQHCFHRLVTALGQIDRCHAAR